MYATHSPPHRILVPVDFTESSKAALEYAALLGSRFGAEVDVLHVWRPPADTSTSSEMLAEFARTDEGRMMRHWLVTLSERGKVEAHGRLSPGQRRDVPDKIVGIVEEEDYDLVVMGAHDHQGLSGLLHRGTADKVVRSARCPVVTVHSESDEPGVVQARTPLSWA